MRFPVFLLGLIFATLVTGLLVWLSGGTIGQALLTAVGVFFMAQIAYVAVIAAMLRNNDVSPRVNSPAPQVSKADLGPSLGRHQLAAPTDPRG